MGISEKTVEKQIAKGARLIAQYVHGDRHTRRHTRAGERETAIELGHDQ
jgi:RNA polymerase sigma-70 factor (ECF subfamily)